MVSGLLFFFLDVQYYVLGCLIELDEVVFLWVSYYSLELSYVVEIWEELLFELVLVEQDGLDRVRVVEDDDDDYSELEDIFVYKRQNVIVLFVFWYLFEILCFGG